jgi:hypothetical protein
VSVELKAWGNSAMTFLSLDLVHGVHSDGPMTMIMDVMMMMMMIITTLLEITRSRL